MNEEEHPKPKNAELPEQDNQPDGEPQPQSNNVNPLEEELAQAKDKMLRAVAEAENVRRRAVKDREDATKYAVSTFARDLLDFADNFARGIASLPDEVKNSDNAAIKTLLDGMSAMEGQLLNTFEKHGITKIEPLDEPFNANFHEVMFETPVADKPAGIIIQIVEPGYVIKGRLLRPARVGVSKAMDGPVQGQSVDTQA